MNKKIFFLYFLFVLLLFFMGIYLNSQSKKASFAFVSPQIKKIYQTSPKETAVVKRVIDGDTIVLSDNRKVRYIGIDSPELHHPTKPIQCFATEAALLNTELVEGKTIVMQKDVSETDKYGRLLRYVWIGDVFVNNYLVEEGFARQETIPPDVAYATLFKESAKKARLQNKGLWSLCN